VENIRAAIVSPIDLRKVEKAVSISFGITGKPNWRRAYFG
jgi:hypothetical protein